MTPEITLDIAKTNYARGERTQAVAFLRRSTRTQPTVDGLLLLARWLQETRLEGRTNIQKVFADIRGLLEGVGDNEKRGKFEYRLARFCDAEHDSPVELHSSHMALERKDVYETCVTEFGKLSTRGAARSSTDTSHLERSIAPLKHDLEALPDPTGYACQAIEHYAAALFLSSRHDLHALLRAVTAWFHNERVPRIQQAAAMLCGAGMIPSAKIVPLVLQLTARLCDPTAAPETVETIKTTLIRLAADHPHHTLVALAAVSNSKSVAEAGQTPSRAVQEILDRVSVTAVAPVVQEYAAFIREMHRLAMTDVSKTPSGIPTPAKLQRAYRNVCVLTHNLPVDPSGRYTDFPFVRGFDPHVELMNGITRPRRVVCVGGNGRRYVHLVKGKDDPRQDATIEQLFGLLDKLFARRADPAPPHPDVRGRPAERRERRDRVGLKHADAVRGGRRAQRDDGAPRDGAPDGAAELAPHEAVRREGEGRGRQARAV